MGSAFFDRLPLLGAWWKRRWEKELPREEQWILYKARQSQGQVKLLSDGERRESWVRAGGVDFNTDGQSIMLYRKALEHLVTLGYLQPESEGLFTMTDSGWAKSKELSIPARGR